jgi:GDP/UDP-N,N'-diacetylbacillosamine 2-epimerase (hydrolysing)
VGHDRAEIGSAIARALDDDGFKARVRSCSQPFGDGRAGERIVEVLRATPIDKRLMVKRMSY